MINVHRILKIRIRPKLSYSLLPLALLSRCLSPCSKVGFWEITSRLLKRCVSSLFLSAQYVSNEFIRTLPFSSKLLGSLLILFGSVASVDHSVDPSPYNLWLTTRCIRTNHYIYATQLHLLTDCESFLLILPFQTADAVGRHWRGSAHLTLVGLHGLLFRRHLRGVVLVDLRARLAITLTMDAAHGECRKCLLLRHLVDSVSVRIVGDRGL